MHCAHRLSRILVQIVESERESDEEHDKDHWEGQNVTSNHLVDHDDKRTGQRGHSSIEEQMHPGAWDCQDNEVVLDVFGRDQRIACIYKSPGECQYDQYAEQVVEYIRRFAHLTSANQLDDAVSYERITTPIQLPSSVSTLWILASLSPSPA